MSSVSAPIAPIPVPVPSTFSFLGNTTEQTVFEFVPTGNIPSRATVWLDIATTTRTSITFRVYHKINGTDYQRVQTFTSSLTDKAVNFVLSGVVNSVKVTMQSTVSEGATRSIPYVYTIDPR